MSSKRRKRVVVAMSGGVDSSTALAILQGQGYDCIGVAMQLWDYSEKESPVGATQGSCCTLDDIHDARTVADRLAVPFYVLNMEEVFSREVVDYFVKSYLEGSTPNPCIKCNEVLKFDALLKKSLGLEADYLATGHYARIERGSEGCRLLKGVDASKDQSYFLFTMTQARLERVLFPLGGLTKEEVRALARRFGLKTSEKAESQEICFVEDGDYAEFMTRGLHVGAAAKAIPGDIVDMGGKVLGTHGGIFGYTVGQRRGLGLSGGPFYVLDIDPGTNRVVVGPESELYSDGLVAANVNWINAEPIGLGSVVSRIRYRHPGVESTLNLTGASTIEVRFTVPQKAVTPGQAVVFYRGEEVLGGGWIERALR